MRKECQICYIFPNYAAIDYQQLTIICHQYAFAMVYGLWPAKCQASVWAKIDSLLIETYE